MMQDDVTFFYRMSQNVKSEMCFARGRNSIIVILKSDKCDIGKNAIGECIFEKDRNFPITNLKKGNFVVCTRCVTNLIKTSLEISAR